MKIFEFFSSYILVLRFDLEAPVGYVLIFVLDKSMDLSEDVRTPLQWKFIHFIMHQE